MIVQKSNSQQSSRPYVPPTNINDSLQLWQQQHQYFQLSPKSQHFPGKARFDRKLNSGLNGYSSQSVNSLRSGQKKLEILPEQHSTKNSFVSVSKFSEQPSKIHSKDETFEMKNQLPQRRLKLMIDKKSIQNDRKAVEIIQKKINESLRQQDEQQQRLQDIRKERLVSMQKKQQKNRMLEAKAGIQKVESRRQSRRLITSHRIQNLSQPKQMIKFSRDRPHDLKGLLVYDYRAALNTLTNGKFEQVQTPPQKYHQTITFKDSHREKSKEHVESQMYLKQFEWEKLRGNNPIGFPRIYLEKYTSKSN